jgi:hypothetical protein
MDSGRDLAERAARALAASSKTSPTAAGPSEPIAGRIDAINQVFTLFRLNYHNQYYKAYEDAAQLNQVKKLWLEGLAGIDVESILRGARRLIEESEYLPTLHRMLECCHEAQFAAHGLPSPREAYREAATAARDSHRWSHAAVWHAARATGLQLLASGREAEVLPLFERRYQDVCERLLAGAELALPPPAQAPQQPTAPAMSAEEKRAALRELRRQTGV